jgi:hypothetical protein
LFNIFINDLIQECLQEGIGAKIGNINVLIIAYCDDIFLLIPTRAYLERLLKICNKFAYGIQRFQINLHKLWDESDREVRLNGWKAYSLQRELLISWSAYW